MTKLLLTCYDYECQLFRKVNQYFKNKYLNYFFSMIIHLGGAVFTISAVLLLLLISSNQTRITALASTVALVLLYSRFFCKKNLSYKKTFSKTRKDYVPC